MEKKTSLRPSQPHPIDGQPARATGNHRVAQNDEPEPEFTEQELIQADLQLSRNKAERFHRRNDRAAVELQADLGSRS